jgi:hypothetical protein
MQPFDDWRGETEASMDVTFSREVLVKGNEYEAYRFASSLLFLELFANPTSMRWHQASPSSYLIYRKAGMVP